MFLITLIDEESGNDMAVLLTRIFVLVLIIAIGSLTYLAKEKWFVSPNEKKSKKYEEDKYKNIDGC